MIYGLLWQLELHERFFCIKICLKLTISKNQQITLWLFNIAMENGPFIDGLPIKNGDFPWLC